MSAVQCLSETEMAALKAEQQRVGFHRGLVQAELVAQRFLLREDAPEVVRATVQKIVGEIAREQYARFEESWVGRIRTDSTETRADIETL